MSHLPHPPKCTSDFPNDTMCGDEGVLFCRSFHDVVPDVYLGFSCLSAFCCVWVFATYFLFPRLGGYSSKVFIYRTAIDFFIAIGHIVAFSAQLPEKETDEHHIGCKVIGIFNEYALMASNLWYTVLAVDLIKAIRNPFRVRSSYGWTSHLAVWGLSVIFTVVLGAFGDHGPGLSMFFWCWISIRDNFVYFSFLSLALYYLPHFLFWLFSTGILVFASCILWGHLAASSETRKFVMKQNAVYVLVLGIETSLIIPLWIAQLIVVSKHRCSDNDNGIAFVTWESFGLAVAFAVIHSLRGTVDLIVWWLTFSIGPKDFKDLYQRTKLRLRRDPYYPTDSLHTPLIEQSPSTINRALRRDAMYCINFGILDAVRLNEEDENRQGHLGSVRDSFVAQAMVRWDAQNQQNITALLHENPSYREQNERKIEFPPSGSIQRFTFVDIEPSSFNLLRRTCGIVPRVYRESFKIKNAADVESSGMLEKFTEGKSGSFFYFTRDRRYIIKTVTTSEERFLQKIAYKYYNHIREHPDSLIVRVFGLHKVRLAPEQGYISVVVMDNIFFTQDSLRIHERYDLKGSTVGRRVLKGNRSRATFKGTLKDMDLDKRIVIGPDTKQQLMEQLRQDVAFLTGCKIMDYSLLLGIHHHSQGQASLHHLQSGSLEVEGGIDFVDVNPRDLRPGLASPISPSRLSVAQEDPYNHSPGHMKYPTKISVLSTISSSGSRGYRDGGRQAHVPWFRMDFGGLRSYSRNHPLSIGEDRHSDVVGVGEYRGMDADSIPVDTYYFGIVDILQQYNFSKSVENLLKTRVLCKSRTGISAVNERDYGTRFLNAMDTIFE